jgi:uncharacterized protein YndB with AHSA1/START domain
MSEAKDKSSVEPFVVSRIFDAPREVVFRAFTEDDRMKHWWGPEGSRLIASQMDLRPGGIYHYGLQALDGSTMWGRFVYREIAAPERIVSVNSFSDARGGLTRHPLRPEWPLEVLSTFLFDDTGSARTKVTVVWAPINENAAERQAFDTSRESVTLGWSGTFDRLARYLSESKSARV